MRTSFAALVAVLPVVAARFAESEVDVLDARREGSSEDPDVLADGRCAALKDSRPGPARDEVMAGEGQAARSEVQAQQVAQGRAEVDVCVGDDHHTTLEEAVGVVHLRSRRRATLDDSVIP